MLCPHRSPRVGIGKCNINCQREPSCSSKLPLVCRPCNDHSPCYFQMKALCLNCILFDAGSQPNYSENGLQKGAPPVFGATFQICLLVSMITHLKQGLLTKTGIIPSFFVQNETIIIQTKSTFILKITSEFPFPVTCKTVYLKYTNRPTKLLLLTWYLA